jgi:hypothetical protein
VKQAKRSPKKTTPPDEILFRLKGATSTFGRSHDIGMSTDEGACAL